MENHVFQVGSILVGVYWMGYNPRYKYFRVKGHTKTGAPRVVELTSVIISEYSTPADSEKKHALSENPEEVGDILPTRWSNKDNKYGVSIPLFGFGTEKTRAVLEPYVPGTIYTESSYY